MPWWGSVDENVNQRLRLQRLRQIEENKSSAANFYYGYGHEFYRDANLRPQAELLALQNDVYYEVVLDGINNRCRPFDGRLPDCLIPQNLSVSEE